MALPNEVKARLEEGIDEWLLNFDEIAEEGMIFLEKIEIEPNLETLLSYAAGVLDSIFSGFIHAQYDRGMNAEEDEEMIELIKGKIPALELKFKAFLREKERKA
jgi:hypothetical protein